jgi:hypothetical protein
MEKSKNPVILNTNSIFIDGAWKAVCLYVCISFIFFVYLQMCRLMLLRGTGWSLLSSTQPSFAETSSQERPGRNVAGKWYVYHFVPKVKALIKCHYVSCRQVADGGDSLQIWRVAANILNKQSRTADKGWSSSLWVGCGANNSSPLKIILLRKFLRSLGPGRIPGINYLSERKWIC